MCEQRTVRSLLGGVLLASSVACRLRCRANHVTARNTRKPYRVRLVATTGVTNVDKIRKTRFADERPTITPVQCMW